MSARANSDHLDDPDDDLARALTGSRSARLFPDHETVLAGHARAPRGGSRRLFRSRASNDRIVERPGRPVALKLIPGLPRPSPRNVQRQFAKILGAEDWAAFSRRKFDLAIRPGATMLMMTRLVTKHLEEVGQPPRPYEGQPRL